MGNPCRAVEHQAQAGVRQGRAVTAGLADHLCVCRSQGIARAALKGALDQIARRGGGLVEAISEVTTGREAQGRFLFSATVELFEDHGFTRGRQVGKHAWIVTRSVDPESVSNGRRG